MLITQFVRDRSDVELERLAREGTWWDGREERRDYGESYSSAPGCLLCNTLDLRRCVDYLAAHERFRYVEGWYMRFADRNGEALTGAMIARLARRELGRRAIAAIGVLSEVERTPQEQGVGT